MRVETIVPSMAMTKVFIFTVILCLLHVGIEGRVVNSLQSFDGPRNNYGFSNSFDRIFDTSKYGILQLNNGLAQTPQMGSVYRLYLLLCLIEFCRIVIFHFSLCLIKDHSYISCEKRSAFEEIFGFPMKFSRVVLTLSECLGVEWLCFLREKIGELCDLLCEL